jgi:nitrous oxidase accessory protein NosD
MRSFATALLALSLCSSARAMTFSVQAAIDAAAEGEVVMLGPGTFDEDIDFKGKAITVMGVGPESVLRGTGTGPVVTFASGEGTDSVLASLTVTGGLADRGGGIFIQGSSPTIVGTVVRENRARQQGSGIYLEASSALVYNNLVILNGHAGGDPHSIEIQAASPQVVNNTIAAGDSNGLILRGSSAAVVMNNIIVQNGSRVAGDRRGRGICDFSGGRAVIHYNLFHRNRVAALLTDGEDFRHVRRAQLRIGPPRLIGNRDGRPEFRRPLARRAEDVAAEDFTLSAGRARARDGGNPDPAFNDADGTPNDIGFTGGPLAPAWLVP